MEKLSIKEMRKKKKGFTLIELIIVIAIIAILAAIAIPKFGKSKQDANAAADKANAKNISLAVAKGIAEDKIKVPSSGDTGSLALNALPGNPSGIVNITTLIDGIDSDTKAKTSGHTNDAFKVKITSDGNVVVYVNASEIYPDPTNSYGPVAAAAAAAS